MTIVLNVCVFKMCQCVLCQKSSIGWPVMRGHVTKSTKSHVQTRDPIGSENAKSFLPDISAPMFHQVSSSLTKGSNYVLKVSKAFNSLSL